MRSWIVIFSSSDLYLFFTTDYNNASYLLYTESERLYDDDGVMGAAALLYYIL